MKRLACVAVTISLVASHAWAQPVNQGSSAPTADAPIAEQLAQLSALVQALQKRMQVLERATAKPPGQIASTIVPRQSPPAPPKPPEVNVSPPPPGAAPGPNGLSVDLFAAERALERGLVQQGYVLLPEGIIEVEPSATYSRSELNIPGFLSSGGTLTAANNSVRQNIYLGSLTGRIGLPWSSQFDLTVPYRYLDQHNTVSVGGIGQTTTNSSGGGLGDVQVSFSKSLVLAHGLWPNIIASVQYGADTGKKAVGIPLGLGYNLLRGSLLLSKQYDPLVLFGQLGYGYGFPAHGFNPGSEYDLQVGTALSVAPEASLRFALDQRFFDYGQRNGSRVVSSGQTLSTFITGASIVIGPRTLLDVSVGIGLTTDTPKYFFRIGVPFRFM